MENKKDMNGLLQKAREYERNEIPDIPAGQKPSFHACAPIGWEIGRASCRERVCLYV